jgi:hypothetical protein
MWICRCVCGTVRPVTSRNLLHGGSLGCGCTKKGLRLRPYEALYNTIRRLKSNQFTYEQIIQIGALINSWRNNGNN